MKRKRLSPTDPREWLRRAKSNLALSKTTNDEVDLADLCFDAQQAAEKAIKAVFIKRGESFPFSHDLERLLRLLEDNGHKIPKYVHAAKELHDSRTLLAIHTSSRTTSPATSVSRKSRPA